jgi:uncharacterized membrane protein YgcG
MEDRSVPALDDVTADRLLAGGIAPDDAPPGYQDVARALHAAALVATDAPTQDGTTAVAAFLDAIPTRRTSRMKKWKIAAATLAGGLTLSTGLAAADVLPGAAQDVASDALAKVGISVPSNHDDHADTRGKSADHKKAKDDSVTEEDSPTTTKPENHGSVVSKVAGDKTTEGADHGSAVCATASDGKCQPNGSNPAAPANKGGHGSVNSTEGSANSDDGAANGGHTSTESETTSTGGASSNSSNSSSSGSSSSSGGGSSNSVGSGSGTSD